VIAGATATGKTGLSLRLAAALDREGIRAEIISADSRQVYRGLDIGTAKVSAADRERIAHHGLDLVDPDEPFSVADYVRHAHAALEAIAATDALAILVGGTGLYLRAVAGGLALDELPSDPGVRAEIEALIDVDGLDAAVDDLRERAPRLAATIDLANSRRVARALEIARIAGDVVRPAARGYEGPSSWIGLGVEPSRHRDWIERRAREQFELGLVDEARMLRERFDPGLPAFSAIGYREAWALLDGTLDREAAIALDAQRNVAFAKRQRTWFRAEPSVTWLDAEDGSGALRAACTEARRLLLART
jgi:tRNA dimethylallyltransferase